MTTCPECGSDRDGAVRFCPGCALDFWRVAAGRPAHAESPPPAMQARVAGFRPRHAIAAGAALLLLATGTAVVMSGILPPGVPGGRLPPARRLTSDEALIRAFFREVRDPGAAYTVSVDAVITMSGLPDAPPPTETTSTIRINGDDWAGSELAVQDDETVLDIEFALVDGVGYLSEGSGAWTAAETPERLHPITPFRRISAVTEVGYLAKTSAGGRPQHVLVVTKWLGGRDYCGILRRYARIESQVSRLEVTVDNTGVPSVAELEITVVASDGRDTVTIENHATYRFGDWDDVEPIEAPTSS